MFTDKKDTAETEVIRLRMNGEWKEYTVEHTGADSKYDIVTCEELQWDWSLLLMEWVQFLYIGYNYELQCRVIVARYAVEDMIGSDQRPIVS